MRRAFWVSIALILAFYASTTAAIIYRESQAMRESFRQHMQRELELMESFAHAAMLRKDYSVIEQSVLRWGEERGNVVALKATTGDGIPLVTYARGEPGPDSLAESRRVELPDGRALTLEMVCSSDDLEARTQALALQMSSAAAVVGLLLWAVLWWTLQTLAIGPLEREVSERTRAEDELKQHSSSLEDLVAQRTRALEQALEGLRSEVAERQRAEAKDRQLRAQLEQAQRLDAIGRLAGGVAHDFNNLLTGIIASAEMLRRKPGDEGKFVEAILDTSQRAAELTSQLLAFSRKGRTQSIPVDVHASIRKAFEILEHSVDERITIEQRLVAERSVVIGDPAQLQSAILNLGLNARDAMPHGGELRVQTSNVDLDAEFGSRSGFEIVPGHYVQILMSDTGAGIPVEAQERVFEPFFTTKAEGHGTGLGLPAVYGTVQAHHGAVLVESAPGKGTVFRLYLPLEDATVPAPPEALEPLEAGSGSVLVVDDEAVIRTAVSEILAGIGYEVLLAQDGQEAIEIYEREQGRIDLVLLDSIMPRMSGHEVLRALKEIEPEVKVLLCSGYDPEASLNSLGARGFLQKPFSATALGAAVKEALLESEDRQGDASS